MDFVHLDSEKVAVLTAAGAVFAAAGLWLMLRPGPQSGSAKIELFGMKFESSSAGLVVFVTGAAFLAAPLFAPTPPAGPSAGDAPDAGAERALEPPAGSDDPASWALIGSDTFTEHDVEWDLGRKPSDELPRNDLRVVSGRLRWDLDFSRFWSTWTLAPYGPAVDFYVAVDVEFIAGHESGDVAAGLVFGAANQTNFRFFVSGDGAFALHQRREEGGFRTLVSFTGLPEALGAPRRLWVRVENDTFRFGVNGALVGVYRRPDFPGGKVGLAVYRSSPGPLVVDFDNFEFRRAPD